MQILCKPQKFYPRNYLSLELFVCDKALSVTLIEVIHYPLFFHRQKLCALDNLWSVMALLKFLKLDPAKKRFPHSSGPLSTIIPSSSIAAANEEVKTGEDKKSGPYVKFSSKVKLVIARHAAENGIAASLRHFATHFPDKRI